MTAIVLLLWSAGAGTGNGCLFQRTNSFCRSKTFPHLLKIDLFNWKYFEWHKYNHRSSFSWNSTTNYERKWKRKKKENVRKCHVCMLMLEHLQPSLFLQFLCFCFCFFFTSLYIWIWYMWLLYAVAFAIEWSNFVAF